MIGDDCNCSEAGSISNLCNINGRCSCRRGFYGAECEKRCNCSYSNSGNCDALGQCICNDGFYGNDCYEVCDCNTNGSAQYRCDRSGYCDCKKNKWGKQCEKDCNCNKCSSLTDECDVFGECKCKPNYRGKLCELPCHCQNSDDFHSCDSNGLCKCHPGFYGAICDQRCMCENAKDTTCDINGYCKCQFGYYGQRCDKLCDCDSNSSSGRCDALGYCKCTDHRYGAKCNKTYSDCGILPATLKDYDVQIPININNPNASIFQPWVVKILKKDNYVCTGVIVVRNWKLTLRRCFTDENDIYYFVKTGDYSHLHHDTGERTYNVEQIIFQDINKDKKSRIKGLALVKLGIQIYHPRKIGYYENSFSQQICVTGIPSFASVTDIGNVMFTGWHKRIEEAPSTMTSLSLQLIPNSECLFAQYYEMDEIICARVPNEFQATSLDQYGAPITALISKKHSLLGLWIKQDKDCSFNCMAYFVNVIKHTEWITNNIFR